MLESIISSYVFLSNSVNEWDKEAKFHSETDNDSADISTNASSTNDEAIVPA